MLTLNFSRIFTKFQQNLLNYKKNPQAVRRFKKGIYYPANIYLFKVNNRNTRTRCEICPNLITKTPEPQVS